MADRVEFNYADWVQAFPAFATSPNEEQVLFAVGLAEQYWRNDGTSPATTTEQQRALLWLMVAHVVTLLYGQNGEAPSGIVGVVNHVSEGSVSVGASWPTTAESAWLLQTSYGALFWQMTAPFRTFRYVPGPQRLTSRWPYSGPAPWFR